MSRVFYISLYLVWLATFGHFSLRLEVAPPVFTHPMLRSLLFLCSTLTFAQAQVTVYGQTAFGLTASTSSSYVPTTTPAAYNNTRLVPPPITSPAPANAFTLTLQESATAVNGLSIPHVGGSFWGFSIEMSVISQVRESNPLNLVYNIFDQFVLVGKNSYVQIYTIKKSLLSDVTIVRFLRYLSST